MLSGRPALAVPQTSSSVMTSHLSLLALRKNTVGPGFTSVAAHSSSPTSAQSYLTISEPSGIASRIADSLHRLLVGDDVGLLVCVGVEVGETGACVVGLSSGEADSEAAVSSLEEQPARTNKKEAAVAPSSALLVLRMISRFC